MKNSSWKYPFPTLEDEMFDQNKDGKLDVLETAFRDAYLDEMNRLVEEDQKKPKSSNYTPIQTEITPEYSNRSNSGQSDHSAFTVLLLIFLAIACIIGGFVLAFMAEGGAFGKAIILFCAVALALFLLRCAGVY
ncbi:MAG: hypothetical protein ACI4IX_03170 [Acutalibacteraceae bacterium]